MKQAVSTSSFTPGTGSNNMGSAGAQITLTVSTACKALVFVNVGTSSNSDFENKPQIWLDGAVYSTSGMNAGAGNTSSRINPRVHMNVVTLTAGSHTLSAGVSLASQTSPNVAAGAAEISAIILGNVTA